MTPCPSNGQLAQLVQPVKKPSVRLHVRADLPAMAESPRNKKVLENQPKKHAIHLHAFQDGVFAAALDADPNPPVILFNAPLEKDLREDS